MPLLHSINQRNTLDLVRTHPGITAPAIAAELQLQTATILYTLKDFEQQGLIYTKGMGKSGLRGGKPARKWYLAGTYGLVAGIDLRIGLSRALVLDFAGQELAKTEIEITNDMDLTRIMEAAAGRINTLVQEVDNRIDRLLGIGISLSSNFRKIHQQDGDQTDNRSLVRALSHADRNSIPIQAIAKHQADVLGVKWYTRQKEELQHYLFVSMKSDLSSFQMAGILDGKLYKGQNEQAGQTVLFMDEHEWQQIYLEINAKFPDARLTLRLTDQGFRPGTMQDVMLAMSSAEPLYTLLAEKIRKRIIKRLQQLEEILDPGLIILGNEFNAMAEDIIADWKQLSSKEPGTKVILAPHRELNTAMGAAAVVLDHILGGTEGRKEA